MACKPGSVVAILATDDHSSGILVTEHLMQPTRTANGDVARVFVLRYRRTPPRYAVPIRFCSWWGLPCRTRYRVRGVLLPHLFTLTFTGGMFSVALSLRSPSPDVIRHHSPLEPGLSSLFKKQRDHPAIWKIKCSIKKCFNHNPDFKAY